MIRWAVARGRIFEEILPLLKTLGLEDPREDPQNNRRLVRPLREGVEIIIARPDDVPLLVQKGVATLGAVGLDSLREQDAQLLELLDLRIGICRLSLASPEGIELHLQPRRRWRVATRYPRITTRWFSEHGYLVEPVPLTGAVEAAVDCGIADMVMDLVDTGATLKAHNLLERAVLLQVSTRLVAHPVRFYQQYEEIKPFLLEIAQQIGERVP
jgi:ATP phosphoribosyltransferase